MRTKKILSIFILTLCFLQCVFFKQIPNVSADDGAKAMIVMESNSGRILEEKNIDEKLPMASTTKIMTALTVLKNCNNIDEIVNVADEAVGVEGTSMYLRKGEKLSVRELLYGLILPSGNDAAVALACHISKTEKEFVNKMNALAKEIGCKNTHFANAHGLDDKEHYTTAYDLAHITKEAIKNEDFLNISKTLNIRLKGSKEGEFRYLRNKNRLLRTCKGCFSGKTGFTDNAGRCFVSCAKRDGLSLICVVLNSPQMFEYSESLLNGCFNKYKMVELVKSNTKLKEVNVKNGNKNSIGTIVLKSFSYPLTESEKDKIRIDTKIKECVDSPVKINQIVGEMKIYLENKLLFTQKIYTIDSVKSVKLKDKITEILDKWNI